jgi:hypothetical protein
LRGRRQNVDSGDTEAPGVSEGSEDISVHPPPEHSLPAASRQTSYVFSSMPGPRYRWTSIAPPMICPVIPSVSRFRTPVPTPRPPGSPSPPCHAVERSGSPWDTSMAGSAGPIGISGQGRSGPRQKWGNSTHHEGLPGANPTTTFPRLRRPRATRGSSRLCHRRTEYERSWRCPPPSSGVEWSSCTRASRVGWWSSST